MHSTPTIEIMAASVPTPVSPSPSVVPEAVPENVPVAEAEPVAAPKTKSRFRAQFMDWLLDGPAEPTIWDKIQYPLKWCIVMLGFVALSAVVAVVGVVALPFAVLKMGLMLPN